MWPCYRLVVDGIATWTEVTTMMDIDDVDLLCMANDIVFDARHAPEPTKPKGPTRRPRAANRLPSPSEAMADLRGIQVGPGQRIVSRVPGGSR